MHFYTPIRLRGCRDFRCVDHCLTFVRAMGGGPRTFPGGLNKWQWKRLHEKKARDKERRLLEHEKQLYQARIRSQIRAKLSPPPQQASAAVTQNPSSDPNQPTYAPMTPQEQIKALADRFMKEGAEDLWNEDDGPIQAPAPEPRRRVVGEPINLRRLISENSNSGQTSGSLSGFSNFRRFSSDTRSSVRGLNFAGHGENGSLENLPTWSRERHFPIFAQRIGDFKGGNIRVWHSFLTSRCYSFDAKRMNKLERFDFPRNKSLKTEDDSKRDALGSRGRRTKWPRFTSNVIDSSDDDNDESDDEAGEGIVANVKRISSAALGKYDMKIKKRIPLQLVEDEYDLSQHVEEIRKEVNQRRLEKSGGEEEEESILSLKRFDECEISPLTVKALTAAGYMQMTRVQEATLSAVLEGRDALVKARTGTGKSAAFLIPAIETVLKPIRSRTVERVPPIYVLILCPTRELASQIAAETNVLLKYHDGIGVQTLVGGTRFKVDQKRLESDPSQIIVATPGRLLDHIENKSGFSTRLMGLKMLILDEADHLLDLGFRKDMEKIVDCLPRQRQSLLFSATIPKEVRRISQLVLKREHAYIDTVGLGLETNEKVKQFYLVAPHEQHFQIVHQLLRGHISEVPDYKIIVFCTTAMMTSLMFSLYQEMKMNVREIHSRKPQLYRTRISDEFKEMRRVILITSDVSARGMNYPDVTLVIQVGIPVDREQYIHRLGRTGREGKDGEGILLIAPWEEYFLDGLKDLPIQKCDLPYLDPNITAKMEESMANIDASVKEAAYHAWLGYYNSIREIGRDKTTLVSLANQFSESIGLEKPPSLFRKTAVKMGLKDIPGIRVRK
nr:probable DEAD-box ATP-dependent RNA helicase 48 [Ipomoea batatas]GMD39461.1 probable DEAD-box ATP-dependent RNA helicase 48 [Ipomoea batatas]